MNTVANSSRGRRDNEYSCCCAARHTGCFCNHPSRCPERPYDNGPTKGTTDAWTINFGFIVSDTFRLGSASSPIGLTIAAWLFPGDVLESAEVSITSSEFGGT